MDRFQRLAHEIIDLVELSIRKAHPTIDAQAADLKGNTLLYGENYYDLENEITELLHQI
ncbi:MAG: hypothetical protein IAX21_07120 [Candidatus Bathyarchaeota archaeon]|nr:hypothetical protein [Candidatus Bathyarchaeum tardum]WGM89286.1 MAG: hypothetical protein NUK63_10305 [Candidatus Bathyarchaeum tardum]WNZ28431.1 MAG: hypothetical protein IAX21_07120 [Candidatus Bathyarchaeota archaeon]